MINKEIEYSTTLRSNNEHVKDLKFIPIYFRKDFKLEH